MSLDIPKGVFNKALLQRIFQNVWNMANDNEDEQDTNATSSTTTTTATTIRNDALELSSEMVKYLVVECLMRAADTAKAEGAIVVDTQHLEKILAQLMLDFA